MKLFKMLLTSVAAAVRHGLAKVAQQSIQALKMQLIKALLLASMDATLTSLSGSTAK